jgi:hypothetical protein
VEWPDGFRQEFLPTPEYQEGDRVQFVRDECCARDGTVHLVLFQGDISRLQAEQGEAIERSNLGTDDIIYLVRARGHDHRVKASHILGRFVSRMGLTCPASPRITRAWSLSTMPDALSAPSEHERGMRLIRLCGAPNPSG